MRFTAEISTEDHHACLAYFDPEGPKQGQSWLDRSTWIPALCWIASLGLGGYLIYLAFGEDDISWLLLLLGASFILVPVFPGSNIKGLERFERPALREGFNVGPVQFNLESEGLSVAFDLARNTYNWRSIQAFSESPEAFYFQVSDVAIPGDTIIVPKRAFATEADLEQFRETCRVNLTQSP